MSPCKVPLFLSDLNHIDIHSKYPQITNVIKIRPVGAELFMWTDGGMDRQTDRGMDGWMDRETERGMDG
jgi:hypothetical protein